MPRSENVVELVDAMRQALGADLKQFAVSRGYDGDAFRIKAGYEGTSDLTSLYDADIGPATYYADSGGEIVLVYVSRAHIDPAAAIKSLGDPEASLRSRKGKQFLHRVWPGRGVAFSSRRGGKDVCLLEVFPPRSLEEYKATLYSDPGTFDE